MTCIVAIKDKKLGKTYIAGDRMVSSQDDSLCPFNTGQPKIFGNDVIRIGIMGNVGLISVLKDFDFDHFKKIYDRIEPIDPFQFLNDELREPMIELFKKYNITYKDSEQSNYIGSLLIVFEQKIFIFDCSFNLTEIDEDFFTIGSGHHVAVGSLYSTKRMASDKRALLALEAASKYLPSVGGPFDIYSI